MERCTLLLVWDEEGFMQSKKLWEPGDSVTEVKPGVFFVQGPASNWVILVDHEVLALIDTGYPADRDRLDQSIRFTGNRPEDVKTILVTHGHSDHIGSAEFYRSKYGSIVRSYVDEKPNVCRTEKHQVGLKSVIPMMHNRRVALWTLHAYRSGALDDVGVHSVESFEAGRAIDAPWNPVPVIVPGHTPGHTCYYLPEPKVMVVGDAFVTGHPISQRSGPQMLNRVFHSDEAQAVRSLAELAKYDVDVYLPGHGPAGTGPIADALARIAAS
jgi:glyoxylase-like metal-dependent hydrolase (beta-lactamase superfamily II)